MTYHVIRTERVHWGRSEEVVRWHLTLRAALAEKRARIKAGEQVRVVSAEEWKVRLREVR